VIKVKEPRVHFKQNDESDILFRVHYDYGVKKKDDLNFIFYDEVDLEIMFDMKIEDEQILGEVKSLQLSKQGDQSRRMPIYVNPDLGMQETEYA